MTGLTTKKYVIVLSVLNLVSDFVKCNRPIHAIHVISHWTFSIVGRGGGGQICFPRPLATTSLAGRRQK
jgi:hypothetical protein